MGLTLAIWLVRVAALYLVLGVLFGVPFVVRGIGRIDPVARHGTWGFRLLVLPGSIALWPWLAWRLARGVMPREHNAHRDRAQ